MKPKTCKGCKLKFTPVRGLQQVCSVPCAVAYSNEQKAKEKAAAAQASKRKTKARLTELKSLSQLKKELQAVFNRFIRLRDADQPCISCGREHQGQYHAGHYRTVGAAPQLRFNEDNCHKQCAPCNNHLSGNIVNYRPRLIAKIGQERVDALESCNAPDKMTREQIQELTLDYRAKCRELEKKMKAAA